MHDRAPFDPSLSTFGASCIQSAHHQGAQLENFVQTVLFSMLALGALFSVL